MLEKLALLKIALCRAPVFSRASACRTSASAALLWGMGFLDSRGVRVTLPTSTAAVKR